MVIRVKKRLTAINVKMTMEKKAYNTPSMEVTIVRTQCLMTGSPLNGVGGNAFNGPITGGSDAARTNGRRSSWRSPWE